MLAVLGDEVEVRSVDGADRAALLPALRRRRRGPRAQRDPHRRRGAGRGAPAARSSPAPASGSTTSTSRRPPPAGVMVVNAPHEQRRQRRRAGRRPAARLRPQPRARQRGAQVRPVGAQPVDRRRGGRQDRRRRRPRPHRRAVRAAHVGVRHLADRLRPVRLARPRRADRRAAGAARRAAARERLHLDPPAEDAGDGRADRRARAAGAVQADRAHRQRRPRRPARRGRARRGARRPARSPARGSTSSRPSRAPTRRCSASTSVVVAPHLGASHRRGAGQGRDLAVARSVRLALAGEFVPDAVNVQAGGVVAEDLRPALPLVEKLGRVFTALAGGVAASVEVLVRGEIAELDVSRAAARRAQGRVRRRRRGAGDLRQRPGARGRARASRRRCPPTARAPTTATSSPSAASLPTASTVSVSGTLTGPRQVEKLTEVDGFDLELVAERNLVFFRYDDRPGVVGPSARRLGEADINIAGAQVSRTEQGGQALMALTVDSPPPPELLDADRRRPSAPTSVRSVDADVTPVRRARTAPRSRTAGSAPVRGCSACPAGPAGPAPTSRTSAGWPPSARWCCSTAGRPARSEVPGRPVDAALRPARRATSRRSASTSARSGSTCSATAPARSSRRRTRPPTPTRLRSLRARDAERPAAGRHAGPTCPASARPGSAEPWYAEAAEAAEALRRARRRRSGSAVRGRPGPSYYGRWDERTAGARRVRRPADAAPAPSSASPPALDAGRRRRRCSPRSGGSTAPGARGRRRARRRDGGRAVARGRRVLPARETAVVPRRRATSRGSTSRRRSARSCASSSRGGERLPGPRARRVP